MATICYFLAGERRALRARLDSVESELERTSSELASLRAMTPNVVEKVREVPVEKEVVRIVEVPVAPKPTAADVDNAQLLKELEPIFAAYVKANAIGSVDSSNPDFVTQVTAAKVLFDSWNMTRNNERRRREESRPMLRYLSAAERYFTETVRALKENDQIMATGSLYLAGNCLHYAGEREMMDGLSCRLCAGKGTKMMPPRGAVKGCPVCLATGRILPCTMEMLKRYLELK